MPQVPALQVRALWQRLEPAQQGWPAAPQATQVPGVPLFALRPMQANPELLQVPWKLLPQQGWPSPPQVPHWLPDAPSRHPSDPVQAGVPASPPPKLKPLPQQGCPAPPQAAQVPPLVCPAGRLQPRPELQVPKFPQQACPEAPQGSHVPALASLWPEQV